MVSSSTSCFIQDSTDRGVALRESGEKLFNSWRRRDKKRSIGDAALAVIAANARYTAALQQARLQNGVPNQPRDDDELDEQNQLLHAARRYREALQRIINLQASGHRRASRNQAINELDGVTNMADAVEASVEDYRNPRPIPDGTPEGYGWVGGWNPIGSGGFGNARIFVQQGAFGEIVRVSAFPRSRPQYIAID